MAPITWCSWISEPQTVTNCMHIKTELLTLSLRIANQCFVSVLWSCFFSFKVCCYLILLFYFVCNIFWLDGSKCYLTSNCTQLKSMYISGNDSARVNMWRSSRNRQWFNGCIFYIKIHSFEAIREFMIKLENRPPQKNEFIIICHDRTGSPNDVR